MKKNKLTTFLLAIIVLSLVLNLFLLTWHAYLRLEATPVLPPRIDFGDEPPEDYYERGCPILYLRLPFADVERWLDGLGWAPPYDEFKENEWDCSDQTAYLDWALKSCGYETKIFAGQNHAWLNIKVRGEWMEYETTFGRFVPKGIPTPDGGRWEFDNIFELWVFFECREKVLLKKWHCPEDYTMKEWLTKEWAWWKDD